MSGHATRNGYGAAAGPEDDSGPAHDPVDGNPATPDRGPAGEDRAGAAGEPVPGTEGEARRAGRAPPPEFNPDAAAEARRDRRPRVQPARRTEPRLGRPLQRGTPRQPRRRWTRKATASTTRWRTWPNRPQSLQDYLAEQLGELELDEDQRQLARHICTLHRPHRLPRHPAEGQKDKAEGQDDEEARSRERVEVFRPCR